MSIPLDRLYHYIESIAQDVCENNVIIYRFFPHGSKKIEDLLPIARHSWVDLFTSPEVICNDQEPLDYKGYQGISKPLDSFEVLLKKHSIELPDTNLRKFINIYDHCILIHSEQRSENVEKYKQEIGRAHV